MKPVEYLLMIKYKYILTIILIAISGLSIGQFYRGYEQEFGKNRVQYRDFFWQYYPYERFEVYYYKGGSDLAVYVVKSADKNLKEVEDFFDFTIDGTIQFISYNKQSEFRQSNIGLQGGGNNIGGVTPIIGSKVFLYYETSHADLEYQIRNHLSQLVFKQMMYGTQWKQVMRSNSVLFIPKWFEEGITAYASEKWNPIVESHVRSGISSGDFDNFNLLSDKQSRFAGQAMWKYIADVYGENVIPNILYMTRASRNVESGFNFVLGVSFNTLLNDMKMYYYNYFFQNGQDNLPTTEPLYSSSDLINFNKENGEEKQLKKAAKILGELPVKSKNKYDYSQIKMSPDQKYIAYATHEMGQYKVWLYDIENGKRKRIFKREPRMDRVADNSFPIIAWHPTSQVLTFAYEYRGRAFLGNYYMEEKNFLEKELFRIDKVVDLHYSSDGKKMIFSGVKEGQTDLYLYQVIGNSQVQLTNDIYDDMNPHFIRNSEAVIFASNRIDDTLRERVPIDLFDLNKDIFILNLDDKSLEQITNTSAIDESHPYEYFGGRNYTFLGDESGINNRYAAFIDSTISRIDTAIHYRYFTVSKQLTEFNQTPFEYDFNVKTGEFSLLFFKDNKFQWFTSNISEDQVIKEGQIIDSNTSLPGQKMPSTVEIISDYAEKKGEIDINNYVFEEDKTRISTNPNVIVINDDVMKAKEDSVEVKEFVLPKPRNYQLNFAIDQISSQANNSFKSEFYQNFTGPNSIYPGLGGMFEVQITDLFENYKLIGGFRLSANLRNNNFAAGYKNVKNRVDKKVTYQRKTERILTDVSLFKVNTNFLNYEWSYPFSELASLRFSAMARNDRLVVLSTDRANLSVPSLNFSTIGGKLAYVFDNTLDRGLNLLNGTRLKLWVEYNQDLRYPNASSEGGINNNTSLYVFEKNTDMKVVGLDIRHYEPIYKNIVIALRAAGSSSFGNFKLINYLGGTDNWIFQKVNAATPVDASQNYVYQTMGTPVRGFFLNTRNGSNFGVINAEVRWPIFKFFIKKPIKSDFINNFQLVGFSDVGSAWNGWSPYSKDNEFNTQVIESGPITVIIDNNREPIIYGYGLGVRSRLLGYFLKVDFAWGVDDGVVLPRTTHLSIGLDF